jgi:predicted NBD/HSP70 family sugar kinase
MDRMMWPRDLGSNVLQVRDHNRALVLWCLSRRGGLSRSEIAERIGLTEAGISRIVRELIDDGLLYETETAPVSGRPGRRHIALDIVADAAYVASICLTAFDHSISVLDLLGKRILRVEFPEILSASGEEAALMIAEKVREVVKTLDIAVSNILGIGITTVGSVDKASRNIIASSINGLNGQNVADPLEQLLGSPVALATIGEAINIGEKVILEKQAAHEDDERQGHDASLNTALVVHVAFGMGANFLVNGRSYGNQQDERLFAHIPISGKEERCICGARGCLLTSASGHSIMRRLKSVDLFSDGGNLNEFDPQELLDVIRVSDDINTAAGKLFYAAGYALGSALFSVTACLPPERIILAGVVGQANTYASGVKDGIRFAWTRVGQKMPHLVVSKLDYGLASDHYTVEEFLLGNAIDAHKLIRR